MFGESYFYNPPKPPRPDTRLSAYIVDLAGPAETKDWQLLGQRWAEYDKYFDCLLVEDSLKRRANIGPFFDFVSSVCERRSIEPEKLQIQMEPFCDGPGSHIETVECEGNKIPLITIDSRTFQDNLPAAKFIFAHELAHYLNGDLDDPNQGQDRHQLRFIWLGLKPTKIHRDAAKRLQTKELKADLTAISLFETQAEGMSAFEAWINQNNELVYKRRDRERMMEKYGHDWRPITESKRYASHPSHGARRRILRSTLGL